MIPRTYMSEEKFNEELAAGNIEYETYEEYKEAADKYYDELDASSDED